MTVLIGGGDCVESLKCEVELRRELNAIFGGYRVR